MPAPILASSRVQGDVLAALRADPSPVEWFYLRPASAYGPRSPGERKGRYGTGGDVLLADAKGRAAVSCGAFLDEIEHPKRARTWFTLAYWAGGPGMRHKPPLLISAPRFCGHSCQCRISREASARQNARSYEPTVDDKRDARITRS